jgi:hypothetical protein
LISRNKSPGCELEKVVEDEGKAPSPEKEPEYLSTGWINNKIAKLEQLAQK